MAREYSQRYITLVKDALTRVNEMKPKEVLEKLEDEDDRFVLLDVRETDEWNTARIEGASHLSKGVIEQEIEETYPNMDRELVLYCNDGYRSALAADNVKRMGYHDVKSLKGGFRAWTQAGFPIEKNAA